MKKLLLIDGNNIMFRSYYATAATGNLMQNAEGAYTNGIYGFVMAFQQIMKMDFTHILVALDPPKGKTFRHEMFPEYKGTRKETPPELVSQFPLMKDYLKAARIPYYEQELYEADDIIGYSAKHFQDQFDEIVLISNDRDLMQLIGPKVHQLISKKGFSDYILYDVSLMQEEMGITPEQIPDYKGLVGDSSDNIPGVPGVGPKTATKLLQEYNDLEHLLEHVDDLKGKTQERLQEFSEQARFSKTLATIKTDFATKLAIADMEYHGEDEYKVNDLFNRLGFHSFLRKRQSANNVIPAPKAAYFVITEAKQLEKILTSPMSLHLELFGTNYHTAEKLAFGLSDGKDSYYVPYKLLYDSPRFAEWLINPKQVKYVYDLKQTKVSLLWDNFDLSGGEFDLLLAIYLLNPNLTKEGFREVVSSFDFQDVAYEEDIYGKGAKSAIPDETVLQKHVTDKARAIFNLRDVVLKQTKEYNQLDLLQEIEIPLAEALARMEFDGIAIDSDKLEEFGNDLAKRIKELETSIYDLAGEEFNINSTKQLGTILFEKLELPYQKKTKTGYSTDVSVLKQLTDFHPIIDRLITYRTLTKLFSTYYEGMKSALELKKDGRIHTMYKQALTQTGRLSSVDPNLQNIPIKTDDGKELRKIFVADPGSLLLSCDYSQIELRVLAEMADVEGLKSAFRNNADVHTHTARLIFRNQDVSALERRQAKAVNFGIIYGKTAWGLSEDLRISPKQAEKFIADYFTNYPEIKTFMDSTIEHAVVNGYVETMFHRRRYIPEVKANNYQTREFGKRMAMNAPIQGSAADILKIAMVNLDKKLHARNLKTKMLLQIHDELVFSVPEAEKHEALELIRDVMENSVPISVPLVVDSSYGTNLYEVKENA